MSDNNAFERFVADHLADDGSGHAQAERIAALIDERTDEQRQWPRWLAFIKEPPMRTNSHLTVGSPTVRLTAILAATMLLAVALAAAGVAGQRLLAASGPIVVAQDGSGTYETITEAVAAAQAGDEILVRPGTYLEAVLIDKDIALRGDGAREEVILEFTEDGPTIRTDYGHLPYGLMLVDSEAVVSDLTVRGPNVAAAFVFVGGAPTLQNVANELEGDFGRGPHTSVAVLHGAGGTVRDSLLDGPAWEVGSSPIPGYEGITGTGVFVAEDNTLDGGFSFDVADGSAFLRNTITDGGIIEPSLIGSGTVLIAENDVAVIEIVGSSDGFTIRDNTVHDPRPGGSGIVLGTGAAIVEGNSISDLRTGIVVPEGASPTITGNRLEGLNTGIRIDGAGSGTVIEGNRFCGNEEDLVVPEGSTLSLDESNVICVDEAE